MKIVRRNLPADITTLMRKKMKQQDNSIVQDATENIETATGLNSEEAPAAQVLAAEAQVEPGLPKVDYPAPELTKKVHPEPTVQAETQPQGCNGGCGGGSGQSFGYVYAIGNIRAAFPSQSVQEEFKRISGRTGSTAPDDELVYDVLSQGENLYLGREICWVLQIDSVDAFIVKPRTYIELFEIIQSIQVNPGEISFATVIGPRGPIAGPEVCNGLQLPIAVANQYYNFTFNQFVDAIVASTQVDSNTASSMLQSMLQIIDNAGETDEHRAINYITLRYMGLYTMAANMLDPSKHPYGIYSLNSVTAKPAAVQGTRRIVDVIFNYDERQSGEKIHWYCRVDVTGQFPFLVSKLNRFYPGP